MVQAVDALARLGEFAAGGFRLAALLLEPLSGFGEFLLGVADAGLQRIDLRAHRDQLDLAAVRHHRLVDSSWLICASSACFSISACSAERSIWVLAANSSSVPRSW